MNRSIWILPGISGSSIQMVSTPKSRGLYGDFNDRYLEVKNSNKQTSEFLTFLFVLMYYVFLVVFAYQLDSGEF